MWVKRNPITGEETEMEEISRCFFYFKLFRSDFNFLCQEGIIKRIEFDRYEWTENASSLAEYFKRIGEKVHNVEGGFWAPIEKVFLIKGEPIKRGSLAKLACKYSNPKNNKKKRESSDAFQKIMKLVMRYREKVEQQTKLKNDFQVIKNLIEETENDVDILLLQSIREKIKNILL